MKRAKPTIAICCALTSVLAAGLFTAGAISPAANDEGKNRDAVTGALDTLEQQLQRRFHDKQNLSFGMERIRRSGARAHNSTVMDARHSLGPVGDDGKPLTRRGIGETMEFEVEPGRWISYRKLKDTMTPENESEKQALAALRSVDVAIYTAGLFDPTSGKPERIKGPAYLRQNSKDAPGGDIALPLAAKGWRSKNDADELRANGWRFRVVKVKADDESCLNCHNRPSVGQPGGKTVHPKVYKIGEPIGILLIATKSK